MSPTPAARHTPNGPHHIRAFDVVGGKKLARGRPSRIVPALHRRE